MHITTFRAGSAERLREVRLSIDEGGQHNLLTLTDNHESHVVVRPESRLIANFPGGNSGDAVFLGEGSRVTPLAPPTGSEGKVELKLHSDTPRLEIKDTILGSIRNIRDIVEGPGWSAEEKVRAERAEAADRFGLPEEWVREEAHLADGHLVFSRRDLNGGLYQADLALPQDVTVQQNGSAWIIEGHRPFDFTFTAVVPEPPLHAYQPEELFSPGALGFADHLREAGDGRADNYETAMKSLMFMARKEKFMAGSWRFLTYFGRDTMFNSMLLKPALTDSAYRNAIQSVIDRLSPAGEVCHEEDLGAWAEQRHVRARLAGAEGGDGPIYDYAMRDDDFLLPLAQKPIFESAPERAVLLNTGDNLEKIASNWNRVLELAEPFAENPTVENLVKLLDGHHVGNWRDSQEGLGWGKYPSDVNVDLVRLSLKAVAENAGQLSPDQLATMEHAAPGFAERLARAGQMAEAWEQAEDLFTVHLSQDQVRERVGSYLDRLGEPEKSFYLSRPVGRDGPTLEEFLDGAPALENGLTFTSLSLTEDGRPVEVPNTDFAFKMFFDSPSARQMDSMLTLLELEYPVGLMTGVGPVVANAGYSEDPVHPEQLNRLAYHGAVIWGWQSEIMRAGLARQLERFEDQPELQDRIRGCLEQLNEARVAAGDLAGSELWTHDVSSGEWQAVAFGGNGAATESNAAQLWSTAYAGVELEVEKALSQPGLTPAAR